MGWEDTKDEDILSLVIVKELQKRMYGSSCFFFSRNVCCMYKVFDFPVTNILSLLHISD